MSSIKDLVVKKSNAVTRAPWRGLSSVWAPRIVAAVTAKVCPDDEDFKEYEVNMFDFVNSSVSHVRTPKELSGRTVQEIDAAIKQLLTTVLTYEGKDEHNRRYIDYFNIFYYCRYIPEYGVIRASFAPQMKPFFLKLQSHFTLYPLAEFLCLSSLHSQKLYEFLSSWKSRPFINIPLEQLYDVLDSSKSSRQHYGKFKQDVLDPAEREINAKTSLHYTWEPVKTGRKVTAIIFRFGECKTGDVDTALSEHLTIEAENEDLSKWQRLSNACFERHFDHCEVCKPNNGRKCDYCRTRGRLAGDRSPEEVFKAVREAHQRQIQAGLIPPTESGKSHKQSRKQSK